MLCKFNERRKRKYARFERNVRELNKTGWLRDTRCICHANAGILPQRWEKLILLKSKAEKKKQLFCSLTGGFREKELLIICLPGEPRGEGTVLVFLFSPQGGGVV